MTRSASARDHPRACGEQHVAGNPPLPVMGSSPRMRGADKRFITKNLGAGIIPAHAGSRVSIADGSNTSGDHPRACGEQLLHEIVPHFTPGSSPRMRGAASPRVEARVLPGIIPAHAGSRTFCSSAFGRSRDHPRACGEQCSIAAMMFWRPGSSPRMRGAVRVDLANLGKAGIIPAHAGSRIDPSSRTNPIGDHPRACGEQVTSIPSDSWIRGSSPRMRGAGVRPRHRR